jgi:hypothetical protein
MCPDFKHAKSSRTQEHSTFIFEVIQISQMQNIMTKNHISKITKSPGIQDPLIKVKNETEKHIALRKKCICINLGEPKAIYFTLSPAQGTTCNKMK